MDRATEYELIARVHQHLQDKTTDTGEPGEIRVRHYLDPDRLKAERRAVFEGLPVAIGHASMAPEPGDYFTHDALGVPIVVVRGDDGVLRAMLNVCRHRGTQVVPSGRGRAARSFACPYHGWSYDRAGELKGVPHRKGFPQLSSADRGLVKLRTEEVAGLVFVTRNEAGTPSAAEHLGTVTGDLEWFGVASHVVYDPRRVERPLNWKVGIDIFLEPYHLRATHENTIFPMFFDNLGLVDRVGPHLRNVFPKRSIASLRDQARENWSLREHANILFHLFPNTLVLVEPDHAAVLHLFPSGPQSTIIESYTLVPSVMDQKARRYWDANNDILYTATDEDFERGESIQRGLPSGANETVLLGTYEHALAHFHRQLDTYLG